MELEKITLMKWHKSETGGYTLDDIHGWTHVVEGRDAWSDRLI